MVKHRVPVDRWLNATGMRFAGRDKNGRCGHDRNEGTILAQPSRSCRVSGGGGNRVTGWCPADGTGTWIETTQGADVPGETSAPRFRARSHRPLAGLEACGAQLLEVDGSRRVLGPLFLVPARLFLTLADDGEAGHDGCDGDETDTQGADSASRVRGACSASTDAPQGSLAASMPFMCSKK